MHRMQTLACNRNSRIPELRSHTGLPIIFVTAPAARVYQTAENELLVHVLDAVAAAGRSSGWAESRTHEIPGAKVRERLSAAQKWQQNRMLHGVERVRPTP